MVEQAKTMTPDQKSIWKQIQQEDLDGYGSAFPFSARLAHENRWSPSYASRVVDEYKRFCFLCVVSGHPVTPSYAVDEAWHLHLLYTDHYWNVWCREILGREFHHGPTRGGAGEAAKFDDWYQKTLQSYAHYFGETPPEDIWPSPEARASTPIPIKVNSKDYWIIPKPKFWRRRTR